VIERCLFKPIEIDRAVAAQGHRYGC